MNFGTLIFIKSFLYMFFVLKSFNTASNVCMIYMKSPKCFICVLLIFPNCFTQRILFQEISNQRALIKGLERTISDKDSELSELQKQLQELIRMREIIYEISAGKKKDK